MRFIDALSKLQTGRTVVDYSRVKLSEDRRPVGVRIEPTLAQKQGRLFL